MEWQCHGSMGWAALVACLLCCPETEPWLQGLGPRGPRRCRVWATRCRQPACMHGSTRKGLLPMHEHNGYAKGRTNGESGHTFLAGAGVR